MNVFIVGLGLMGASYAMRLKAKNYLVYGYDNDPKTRQSALSDGLILSDELSFISEADMVIFALYPKATIEFIRKHLNLFKPHTLITDLVGTKEHLIDRLEKILPKNIRYTSHHPMAGRAKTGYTHKDSTMFNNANFLIVKTSRTQPEDIDILTKMAEAMSFKTITILTPEEHDKAIAYTSQLTHVIAVALMHANPLKDLHALTGDSFRDLTRIANINAAMWTELFIETQPVLSLVIEQFIEQLKVIKTHIDNKDEKALCHLLEEAKQLYQSIAR